jgi:large subunit ribosomal protein L19e
MNLRKKRELAARTFKVGKSRILFINSRLAEIKEAITKQDIRDLVISGAIQIKKVKGRRAIERSTSKIGNGKLRLKTNKRKGEYMKLTRKLRKHVAEMKNNKNLNKNQVQEIREKIRNRHFKSKSHLNEYLGGLKHENTKKKKN